MTALSLAVDVAGAALFALVGLGVLLLSRRRRRGILVGSAATAFGMTWVFQNLAGGGSTAMVVGLLISSALAAVSFVALAHHLARPLRPRSRRGLLGLGVVLVLAWSTSVFLRGRIGNFEWPLAAAAWNVYGAFLFALVLLIGAIAAAFREAGPARRSVAALGLAFGPFIVFLTAGFAGSAGFEPRWVGTGLDLVFLLTGGVTALAILPFAHGRAASDRLSRAVFPALVASGLAGLLLVVAPVNYDGYGAFGIFRTLGAFFLALAVLKLDLLEVELPRLAAQRGTLATGALAALFIVAQIAQEFFAAEYGLLMGGVAAGALLFAANPVQRAMERFAEGQRVPVRAAPAAAPLAPTGDVARREAVFRNALRVALRDKRLTRAEEIHLHQLAEELCIPAGRAHAILADVEAEAGAP